MSSVVALCEESQFLEVLVLRERILPDSEAERVQVALLYGITKYKSITDTSLGQSKSGICTGHEQEGKQNREEYIIYRRDLPGL